MLTAFLILLLAAVIVAALCPDIPIGRALRRRLIEAPAAWLGELSLAKALAVTMLVMFMVAAPEFALLLGADFTLFLEALAATSLIAAHLRFREALKEITAVARRMAAGVRRLTRSRDREGSRPASKRPCKPRRDDPEPAGFAFA